MDNAAPQLTPWIDILPPPPPASGLSAWLLIVLLVTTVIAVTVLLRYWYTRPKQRAQRQLKHIAQQLKQPQHDTKRLAFALAEALRVGFNVTQLVQITSVLYDPYARILYAELSRGCYQATSPSRDELHHWLQQARRLLQQAWLFHVRR